ncbi:MAG: ABC transporter ATP-binding protein [Candidatus Hodarchaeota archaeon]
MTFLVCEDLIKIFTDPLSGIQVPALRGVELSVKKGELVSIIGPSGSGKTTLINLIGRMDLPSSGRIFVDEKNICMLPEKKLDWYRRNMVGFLFQFPERNLIWNLPALTNVLLPMRISSKFTREERLKRAKDLLKRVGLGNRLAHKAGRLSGGEAQRLGIAVALANDPLLLLADEPTGELDTATTFQIIDYFRELNRDLGKTILIVTHDMRFAKMTSQSYRLRDGRIVGVQRAIDPHRLKREGISEREDVIYVDLHGNLRLPENVRKEIGIKTYARVVSKGDHIAIYPVEDTT